MDHRDRRWRRSPGSWDKQRHGRPPPPPLHPPAIGTAATFLRPPPCADSSPGATARSRSDGDRRRITALMAEVIPASVLRNLSDKLYKKRKNAALEVEGIVKQLTSSPPPFAVASATSLPPPFAATSASATSSPRPIAAAAAAMDPTHQMAAILCPDLAPIDHLVQCLPSAADREKLQDLLPVMMQTLPESLNHGLEATAQEALELLIEPAGTEPRFLRRQLPNVIGVMLQIAEADSPEVGTMHLAVEFVISLAEAHECAPGMMRQIPHFVERLFAILMNVLLDVDDEPAWHSGEMEDEDAGESSNFCVGKECLDRFLIALGGSTFVPVASELLPAYLVAPEWQEHHAALITFAQITEGYSKYGKQMIQEGTGTSLASVADSSQEQFQTYYNAKCISLVGMSVVKEPGCSWVELNNIVHVFVVGEQLHPEYMNIYDEVKRLRKNMRDEGYDPGLE